MPRPQVAVVPGQRPWPDRLHPIPEGAILVYDHAADLEIGTVTDLGRGGLRFEYFDTGGRFRKEGELDLLLGDSEYFITAVPYRVVSDARIETEEHSPVAIRRCDVLFRPTDDGKAAEIETFIHFYADPRPDTEGLPDAGPPDGPEGPGRWIP